MLPEPDANSIFDEDSSADVTGECRAIAADGAAMLARANDEVDSFLGTLDKLGEIMTRRMRRRLLVLLVDDQAMTLTALAIALDRGGIEVHGAKSAHDAMELARKFAYDAAVVDAVLGIGGTGSDLVKDLRRLGLNPEMPIILISGRDPEELPAMARECGADDALAKPFGPKELLAKLLEHLPIPASH